MRDRSQDEQALMRIQHEWTEARIKGDSSYRRRIEADDCTVVWPDGRIMNKRGDLESMTGDIVFSEFKIHNLQVRLYGETAIVIREGIIKADEAQASSSQREVRVDRTHFVNPADQWKVIASQITPVLEK